MMIPTNLRARYLVPITVRECRAHLVAMFGIAKVPHGSTCYYVAGIHQHCNAPGLYLTAGSGGMCGVLIVPKAQALEETKAS